VIAATIDDRCHVRDVLSGRGDYRPGELLRLLEPTHRFQI
jgi:hypothetical protein